MTTAQIIMIATVVAYLILMLAIGLIILSAIFISAAESSVLS